MHKIEQLFVAIKAVVVKDGKILLLQESSAYQDGVNMGKWDVPGGRMQPGESWKESLLREVEEETGLNVEISRPVGVGEWFPTIRGVPSQVVGMYVECLANTDRIKLSQDHADGKWFLPKEILQINNTIPPTQEMTQNYLEILKRTA